MVLLNVMKHFKTIKSYVLDNRRYIAAGFIALIFVDILQLSIPRVVKLAVDILAAGTGDEAALLRYAAVIAALGLCMGLFRFCWRYCFIGTSRRIERELRRRLFSHLVRLPLSSFITTRTGDFMARMTNDLESVRMCAGIGLVAMIDTVFLGIASICFMLYISPLLTLVCLAPMVFIIITTWRLSSLLHKRFSRVQAAFSLLTEKVRETIAGIAVIKAYVRENSSRDDFRNVSTQYLKRNIELIRVLGLFFPGIMFLANISVAILIFVGGRFAVTGTITTGDFVAFVSYLWILTWPMMALGWVVNLYQRGAASMVRINEVLNMQPEKISLGETPPRPRLKGDILIKNLTFSYAYGSPPALRNINMSIPRGTTVGITGKTGSGKSTLCNLLLRLYPPPPQAICIDGTDIRTVALSHLRTSIAYVPQDSFLFSESIRDNIAFGKPESGLEEIGQYARTAQVADEILEFSDTFNTVLGERGITLSGGQKQRLCISRALLLKAPILILDDSMSSLDVATSKKIVEALKAVDTQQTRIIVSNRIETIKHADNIFVFADGEISETGSHEELVMHKGLYHNLYLKQQLESEPM